MNVTQDKKQEQDKFKNSKVKEVMELLQKHKNGLTAKEIGDAIKVKDTRLVREITRAAIEEAAKTSTLEGKAERISGKAIKRYFITKNSKGTITSVTMADDFGHEVPKKK